MKKEDYTDIIKGLTNPDTQADALVQLSDKLALHEMEYINNQNTINGLRDINAKLALRITEPIKDQPKEEPKQDPYELLINDLKGGMNNVKQ